MKTRYLILIGYVISFMLAFRMIIWLVKVRMDHSHMEEGLGKFFATLGTLMHYIIIHGVVFTVIAALGWLIARVQGNKEAEAGFRLSAAVILIYWVAGIIVSLVK